MTEKPEITTNLASLELALIKRRSIKGQITYKTKNYLDKVIKLKII